MEIHPNFRLNGNHFTTEELVEVAYSWIKEGELFEKASGDFLLEWFGPSEIITVNTSGSTGVPKSIALQKEQMINSARATGKYFDLQSGNSALLCLSPDFIAGKMMWVRAMVLGLELDLVEPNATVLEKTNKSYDFSAMVPLQASASLKKLNLIKKLIIGGAPIGNQLRSKLKTVQTAIYETYGMTETITHIAVKKISGKESEKDRDYFETLPGIGIEKDQRGCLVIDAPRISSSKIVTNDLVELIDEHHFKWLGRWDNVINSGGIKLVPEQIEAKLSTIIPNRFFVAAIPDEKLGQKLVLVIEGILETEKLTNQMKTSLDKFEIPKTIHMLPNFRLIGNGKIDRKANLKLLFKS